MVHFLETNWFWILLIGGMLVMHLGHGHGGHAGGMGGCGGHMGHGTQPDRHASHGGAASEDYPGDGAPQDGSSRPAAAGKRSP